MNKSLAHFISIALHPLLMPLYGLFLLFQLNTYVTYTLPENLRQLLYFLTFINMFGVPASFAFLLYRRGHIQSLAMREQKERIMPFISAVILFYFTYYLFAQITLPQIILSMVLGATLAVFTAFLMNFITKVSIHMVGIGGLAAAFLAFGLAYSVDTFFTFSLLCLLTGLVGTARLSLAAHRPIEIYTGFGLGFLVEFVVVWLKLG